MVSKVEDRKQKEAERRTNRRKRRIRNQVRVYMTLILTLALLAAGVFFGIQYMTQKLEEDTKRKAEQQQAEEAAETEAAQGQESEEASNPAVVSPEKTDKEKLDEIIDAMIAVMPVEDKVAGLFMVTPEDITNVSVAIQAGEGTKEALNQYAVGGLVYFGQNIQSREQLTEMLSNTALWSKYPLFLATDEEGGEVSRVANSDIEVAKVPSAAEIGSDDDMHKARQAGNTIGTYLKELGFNLNLAPVADVLSVDIENSAIGNRSYGSDAQLAGNMVSGMVKGMAEAGVSSCLKHFPGLGDTTADTHEGIATTERTLEDFQQKDFKAFQAGIDAGADFVMVGHLSAPKLTGDNTPCSLSKKVITDILRLEMGYDGVVITDALNMEAITEYYSADQAAIMALKAGCDMVLMPEDFRLAYDGVLEAVQNGTISEERVNDSLRRIYRIKYADKLEN